MAAAVALLDVAAVLFCMLLLLLLLMCLYDVRAVTAAAVVDS